MRNYCLISCYKKNLYAINSFFKKVPQRKWTWASSVGVTKNEIELIISNRKTIVKDVTVPNNLSKGSDDSAVRGKISTNLVAERTKLNKKTAYRGSLS